MRYFDFKFSLGDDHNSNAIDYISCNGINYISCDGINNSNNEYDYEIKPNMEILLYVPYNFFLPDLAANKGISLIYFVYYN